MYKRLATLILLLAALALNPAAHTQAQPLPRGADIGVTYTLERSKIASVDCGCFWMHGGAVDAAVPLFHGLGAAATFSGGHSSNIAPGVDLSELSFMGGPRYTLSTNRWTEHWMTPRHETSLFGEALFGYVHGFDSVFPTSGGLQPSANALAMQIGGGLNIGVAKHFGVRALELYYLRTNLPNNTNDVQNDLRLGFGVSYHIGK
jgi:outer membrane immunogenic protein